MKTKKCINSILITTFSFLLLFCLSGCAATKQEMLDSGMKQLTTKELKALFSEKRVVKVYNTKKNRWYAYTYLPDGSISIAGKTKNRLRVYTIDNDRFCLKRKPTSREKICTSWLKIDTDTYYTYESDGSLLDKQTFQ
jgi:hypothetical protein